MSEYDEIRRARNKKLGQEQPRTPMWRLLKKIEDMLRIYAETRGHAAECEEISA
jgi:hypothetical protein